MPAIAANTDYFLTVALGNLVPHGFAGGVYDLNLQADGVTVATTQVTQPSISSTPNTFVDFTVELTAATVATEDLSGETLGIQLEAGADSNSNPNQDIFDNVRLSSELVPEPSAFVLIALGMATVFTAARFRRFGGSNL